MQNLWLDSFQEYLVIFLMKVVLNVFSFLANTLTESILREIFHMVIQESCEALENLSRDVLETRTETGRRIKELWF